MQSDDLAARGVRVKALDEALADLRKAVEGGQPWHPRDFESFTPKRAQTVATILNAVVDGTLAPAAPIREAEARGMERAADVVRSHGGVAREKLRETYDAGDARGNNLWGCIVGHLDIADDAIRAEAAALKGKTT